MNPAEAIAVLGKDRYDKIVQDSSDLVAMILRGEHPTLRVHNGQKDEGKAHPGIRTAIAC
jgi:hypothetical protein